MKEGASWIGLGAALLLALSGCQRAAVDNDAARVKGLDQAFPGLGSMPVPTELPASGGEVKLFVRVAVEAHGTGDLAGAAILLKRAMRGAGMTLDQVNAVQAARNGWTRELRERAKQGDEEAKAGLAAVNAAR
jgi:hypothetical protein